MLDECLLEEDYKYARYYLKNLRLLQKTLFNLYALSDYNHAEKAEILRVLKNIEIVSKKYQDDSFNNFRNDRLKELKEKLSALNYLPAEEVEEKAVQSHGDQQDQQLSPLFDIDPVQRPGAAQRLTQTPQDEAIPREVVRQKERHRQPDFCHRSQFAGRTWQFAALL